LNKAAATVSVELPAVAAHKPRSRRKSEARQAKVEEKFEQKRLRRKLLAVLPMVGAWAVRQHNAEAVAVAAVDAFVEAHGGDDESIVLPEAPSSGKKRGVDDGVLPAAAAAGAHTGKRCAAGVCGDARPSVLVQVEACCTCDECGAVRYGFVPFRADLDHGGHYCERCWRTYELADDDICFDLFD
jgi:hypothetical protein